MDTLESVRKILSYTGRGDLADLLSRGKLVFDVSDQYGSYLFSLLTTAQIFAPIQDCERLRVLPDDDVNAILDALLEIHPPKEREMEITSIAFRVDPTAPTGAELAEAREASLDQVPSCWLPDSFRLFITHVHTHKLLAAQLRTTLREFWVSCFVAHNDIEPTKQWQEEIELALRTADALLALLSDDFHGSCWTDQEVGIGIGTGLVVVPVKLDIDPYGFIAKYQALKASGLDATALAAVVVDTLIKNRRTHNKMALALATALRYSGGFNSSFVIMAALEKIPQATPEMIRLLSEAVESNYQVSNAWGVPARVGRLLSSWRQAGAT
jgi:hypothetical protein